MMNPAPPQYLTELEMRELVGDLSQEDARVLEVGRHAYRLECQHQAKLEARRTAWYAQFPPLGRPSAAA